VSHGGSQFHALTIYHMLFFVPTWSDGGSCLLLLVLFCHGLR